MKSRKASINPKPQLKFKTTLKMSQSPPVLQTLTTQRRTQPRSFQASKRWTNNSKAKTTNSLNPVMLTVPTRQILLPAALMLMLKVSNSLPVLLSSLLKLCKVWPMKTATSLALMARKGTQALSLKGKTKSDYRVQIYDLTKRAMESSFPKYG